MVRTFIAVELPKAIIEKLSELEKELKKSGADVKYVSPENLHITLRFLGEIDEKDMENVKTGCEKAAEGTAPFEISLRGIGVFPSFDYMKILWARVEKGVNELVKLKNALDNFVEIGEKDSRAFSPHITLGRVRTAKNKEVLAEKIKELQNVELGPFECKEIKVERSELSPMGPIYADLYSVKL